MDSQENPSKENHPDPTNPIRAPFVTLALSRKLLTTMGWCIVGLCIVTIILAVGFTTSINRRPWILTNLGDGYQEVGLSRSTQATRNDVERFLNFVIPNLYGSLNAEGPGLREIRGLVNENILMEQEKALEDKATSLKREGIGQFAIVTGINADTLVIDRRKNFVYVEAVGTVVLTQANRSQKTDVQWRCLLFIVEPTDALASTTPAGKMKGNRMGLFLQQIAEQAPGTINEDSPKPSALDAQDRANESK